MIEYMILLGIVQGAVEWLPVSSEGFMVLIQNYYSPGKSLDEMIGVALFLHLGTFGAALVYFRKDVGRLLGMVFKYKDGSVEDRKLFVFLLVSTVISGVIGAVILLSLSFIENILTVTGEIAALLIGFLLLLTSLLSFKTKEIGSKKQKDIDLVDGLILGVTQGLTALPGLSRSGTTVGFLLMRGFKDEEALRLSFLMSLPIVLIANIGLNFVGEFNISPNLLIGLVASFVFGFLTIDWLIKIARKVKFAWFTLAFGILIIASVFIF